MLRPDGVTIIDSISFGPQTIDQSYGRVLDGHDEWGFMVPTPGSSNTSLSLFMNNQYQRTIDYFKIFQIRLIHQQ